MLNWQLASVYLRIFLCQQSLAAVVRQVRAINTVGGTSRFSIVVLCECLDIQEVKTTLDKCGITNHSIGYVHTKTTLAASNSKLHIHCIKFAAPSNCIIINWCDKFVMGHHHYSFLNYSVRSFKKANSPHGSGFGRNLCVHRGSRSLFLKRHSVTER